MKITCTSMAALLCKTCLAFLVPAIICHDAFSRPSSGKPESAVTRIHHRDLSVTLADPCLPVSTLACADLKVSLPFTLTFSGSVPGTLADRNGSGTGFTTVNSYSGTRTSSDGSPASLSMPGYEPSRITVSGGRLQLVTNKGIDYMRNNNQINTLGVMTAPVKKLQLEVKIINPVNKPDAQQGGLWYGLNDKTYVKLNISGNKVEMRKELNDITSTMSLATNPDRRITAAIANLNTKTVLLRMVIDSAAGRVEGFYSIDNGATFANVGTTSPTTFLDIRAMGITGGVSYAGIFATSRSGSATETYNFDDFTVTDMSPPVTGFQTANINFRPQGTAAPAGYTADNGLPFDAGRKFGWVNPATKSPVNMQASMRLRSGSGDARQLSLVRMQETGDGEVPGSWEYAVPSGSYRVTISSGDGDDLDSDHQINVEGLPVISDFIPTDQDKFRVATATVQVNDGRLTIDATGGVYTKMNYITISQASSVADATPPTASARLAGTMESPNVYSGQVQIFATAADVGASGLATLQYSINNSAYTNYLVPFVLSTPNNYSLNIRAVDASNNETITSAYSFSIGVPDGTQTLFFSTDKLSFTVLKGQPVNPQSVALTASQGSPELSLSKTEASWLTLPAGSNNLQFGPSNISSNIDAGDYQALVTCSASGYQPATLLIDLHVIDRLQVPATMVNFQNAATLPPVNHIRDFGQPYDLRSGRYQSVGLQYGWKRRSDGSLLDLTLNGRNRNIPDDVLLATLMHMQADDIQDNTFVGTKIEGYWEMKVPNGTYNVTASVGDGTVGLQTEIHSINVEGVNVINRFVPSGNPGTSTRFKAGTVRVNVTDENLTINADGGTNTKINYANIVPVSLSPYLFWASANANLILKKDTTESNTFSVILGTSTSASASYTLTASYEAGASGWLSYNGSPSGDQPKVSFNYSGARNLPLGIYKAAIRAASAGFTSALFNIQLNVVDGSKPYVVSSNPLNGAVNVSLSTASVSANNLRVPEVTGYQGGVDNSTIDSNSVRLLKLVDHVFSPVKGVINGTGGGDAIGFSPSSGLEANTVYRFVVTSSVKSHSGMPFAPYEATFTTASGKVDSANVIPARFTKVPIAATRRKKYTSLTIGPDDRLYALRMDGVIERYIINHSDGSLAIQSTINTLVNKYGTRSAIGLVFDPKSTSSSLIAWVSHSSSGLAAAPAFDGNVSRLQGSDLQNEQLTLTRMPRSKKDHLTNSLAFGPDGALYICQGSMNSAGRSDADWQRDETLMSGAVLRLDFDKLSSFTLPLNVQTTANQNLINSASAGAVRLSDNTYNPYATAAPLTIYASGVRNAYDLVWHSNGQLYLPTNGSGGGGNSPASVNNTRNPNGTRYNGPQIPATTSIKAQHDWLFRVNPAKTVGYYGHPNPLRGEYVLNRGYEDNPLYLPSVRADANYRGAAYDFGLNNSPNGTLEYKSNTFNGALKGKILVCRFSGGGDIAVMEPGSMIKTTYSGNDDSIYDVVKVTTGSGNNGLVGMSGFGNPLDIVEDVVNGNLYVIEYNWNNSPSLTAQITLLRAQTGAAPAIRVAARSSYETQTEPAEEEVISTQNKKYDFTLSNGGEGTLDVKSISIEGPDAAKFQIADFSLPSYDSPLQIDQDSPVSFRVHSFALPNESLHAKLVVTTMDNTVREVEMTNVLTDLARINKNEEIKESGHNLEVFPNPSLGKPVSVRLKKFSKQEPVTIYLYDMKGNIIKSESAVTDGNGEFTTQIAVKNNNNFIVRVVYVSGFKFAKVIHIN